MDDVASCSMVEVLFLDSTYGIVVAEQFPVKSNESHCVKFLEFSDLGWILTCPLYVFEDDPDETPFEIILLFVFFPK